MRIKSLNCTEHPGNLSVSSAATLWKVTFSGTRWTNTNLSLNKWKKKWNEKTNLKQIAILNMCVNTYKIKTISLPSLSPSTPISTTKHNHHHTTPPQNEILVNTEPESVNGHCFWFTHLSHILDEYVTFALSQQKNKTKTKNRNSEHSLFSSILRSICSIRKKRRQLFWLLKNQLKSDFSKKKTWMNNTHTTHKLE